MDTNIDGMPLNMA